MPDVPLIPRTVLFGNPDKASAQLSPDGTRIAYLAPLDGVLNVWIGNASGEDMRPVTHDTDRGVRVYAWAHDNRHLLYLQDEGGDENWRLHKVNPETGADEDLTPFPRVQAQMVAHQKERPHEVLVALNKDDERLHDVYHLDLRSNELTLVAKNPGDVTGWVADDALVVRGALATTPDGGSILRLRDTAEGPWRDFIVWSSQDALNSSPLGFTADGQHMHVLDSRDGAIQGEALAFAVPREVGV